MYIEYICCIGGMLGKHYLKLSQIFSFFLKFSQMPDEGGLSNTFFSIANFGGPKIISNFLKLFQIFSNFLGIHFYVLAFSENYLKLSQNFSNYLKFSQIISNFLKFSQMFSCFF